MFRMNAVSFPDMIKSNKTAIKRDKAASEQNARLLIASDKLTLFGDPYFGSNIKKLLFDSNNVILQDIIIDDIYSAISTYMPQIRLLRENISVQSDRNTVTVRIRAQNLLDYTFEEYTLNLLTVEEA